MTTRAKIAEYINAAHEFADLAGAAILPHFRRRIRIDNKADSGFDPVTAADRAAERAISKALATRFPDHGLEGEEYGHRNPDARMRWVVDPIDGTRAFILGMPLWGTLIGLMDGDTPMVGLMDQPYTRERFWSGERLRSSVEPTARNAASRRAAAPAWQTRCSRQRTHTSSSPRKTSVVSKPSRSVSGSFGTAATAIPTACWRQG